MATRNVVLTDRQVKLVDQMVKSGRYQNGSEVLRAGLRLLERQHEEDAAKLRALRGAARLGLADIKAGRFTTHRSAKSLASHLEDLVEEAFAIDKE